MNAMVGVKFINPGTPFNPNDNARKIQLKHSPSADTCGICKLNYIYILVLENKLI